MIARRVTTTWSFIGVVLVFVSVAVSGPVIQPQAVLAHMQPTPATPYAQMKWVKLGELVPTAADADDVYIRLIAIEDEVVLPANNE